MSITLNAREVLSYLNELGYQNITGEQLKDFIKDLKKLIKYETKQNRKYVHNSSSDYIHQPAPSHCAPTEASKAKQTAKKESIVSIQIKRPSHACDLLPDTQTYNKQNAERKLQNKKSLDSEQSKLSVDQTVSASVPEPSLTESASVIASPRRPRSCGPDCQRPKSKVKFKNLQPKASYIVPRQPAKISKTDPVALYHKYQEEWKKHKLPGEDNYPELRWAIRERMLGQPRAVISAAPSMEVIARRRHLASRA